MLLAHNLPCLASLLLLSFFSFVLGNTKLTAVPRHLHLRSRDINFEPGLHQKSLYFAGGSDSGAQAARISLQPKIPTLILEDVQDHVKDIACFESQMVIYFYGEGTLAMVVDSWASALSFLFLTSHDKCATGGQYGAYLVSLMSFDPTTLAVTLSAIPTTIKARMHRVHVEVGQHLFHALLPRTLPRQVQAPAATEPGTSSPSFSFSAPTSSPTSSTLTEDFNPSFKNTQILPPDNTIANKLLSDVAGIDLHGMKLRCVECTLSGALRLDTGNFSVVLDNESDDGLQLIDEVYLRFTASRLSAFMSFELELPSQFKYPFTAHLPSISLGGVTIAGIVNLGPILELTFPMSVALSLDNPLKFRSGFNLTVPADSQINIYFNDTQDSTTGFQDTKFEMLPFDSDVDLDITNFALHFSAGFRPQLNVGAGAGSSGAEVSGGVGVYLDLPQLSADVRVLENVSDTCEPLVTKSKADAKAKYVHVNSSATFGGGVFANMGVSVEAMDLDLSESTQVPLPMMATSTPLASQCLKRSSGKDGQGLENGTDKGAAASRRKEMMDGICGSGMSFYLVALLVVSMAAML